MKSLVLGLLLICFEGTSDHHWIGFRGDGSSTASSNLPLEWNGTRNIAWRARLSGYGQSSPVVWNGNVFTTAVKGAKKETSLITCIDAKSGDLRWEKEFSATQQGKNNPSVSRAASTPVVDETGIIALFESGDLRLLSHEGETQWERALAKEFGEIKNHHGIASSLAQSERAVFVLIEHGGASFLMAVDKSNGETLWKVDRASGLSWGSPVVARFGNRDYVVVSSNGTAAIYDAENGKEVWLLKGLTGNLIPSATFLGNYIVIGAGEGGLTFDANAATKSNRAFKVTVNSSDLKCEELWQGNRIVMHHASPVIHERCVYLLNKVGVVHCLDLDTGKELFVQRLENSCWATPIAASDRIYFFGKDGTTTVIRKGPKFEKLAVNRIWDASVISERKEASRSMVENQFPALPEKAKTQMEAMLEDAVGDIVYGVAAAENSFYLRTGTELICIRKAANP